MVATPPTVSAATETATDDDHECPDGAVQQQRRRPRPDDMAQRVKELGRNARRRLREEQDKRPEIVRLHPDDDADTRLPSHLHPPAGEPVTVVTGRLVLPPPPRQKKRRPLPPAARMTATTDSGAVDRWIPAHHHLLRPLQATVDSNNISSNEHHHSHSSPLVRVHGVPIGTTPGDLRRFFLGLAPERIMVLVPSTVPATDVDDFSFAPSNTSSSTTDFIASWDAHDHLPLRKQTGLRVPRYGSSQLRVYVKFTSAPVAVLATQRTGELLHLHSTASSVHQQPPRDDAAFHHHHLPAASPLAVAEAPTDPATTTVSAAVAVTLVPTSVAHYFLRHALLIEGISAHPLHHTVRRLWWGLEAMTRTQHDMEEADDPPRRHFPPRSPRLDATAVTLLWAALRHELHLPSPGYWTGKKRVEERHVMVKLVAETILRWPEAEGNATLAQLHHYRTILQDEKKRLVDRVPFPSGVLLDPAMARDHVLRLTAHAVSALDRLLERLDSHVRQRKRWSMLSTVALTPSSCFFLALPNPNEDESRIYNT